MHLGAAHEQFSILGFAYCPFDRRIKAGPATAGFIFCRLIEQGRITADAMINSGPCGEVLVTAGPFCSVFARHLIGKVGQLLPPFRIGSGNSGHDFPLFIRSFLDHIQADVMKGKCHHKGLNMDILIRGRYRACRAETQSEVEEAQHLRAQAFAAKADGRDSDVFDNKCDHILLRDQDSGALVACYRLMLLPDGAAIDQCYSAQYYDLSALKKFKSPMLELGRFCIHPDHHDPEILRVAWGAMTRIVDGQGVGMLFGCSSFAGVDASAHTAAFALLQAEHLAPDPWQIGVKAREVVPLSGGVVPPDAIRHIPPLLRTYLAMGGWVSDHAVIDRQMNTLHVFTGVEISAIPEVRKRLLRAVAG